MRSLLNRPSRRLAIQSLLSMKLNVELLEPRLNMALDVPALSSLPGANHTIYLDFDGHVTTGTSWNTGYGVSTITSPAYSSDADTANFSAGELNVIQQTFRRVAEDFAPFQINVTTVAPSIDDLRNSGGTDQKWGVRVVVTRDVAFNCGCGGIAYINSFNDTIDTPVFVFNTSEIGVAEAASHEVGHSLGLSHDGTSTASYYSGHGLGTDTNYWSTIMGVGYYSDVSQWDKGEYYGSNNASSSANYGRGPDDLAIITSFNGFGYKADDHGNTTLTASSLSLAGTTVSGSGIISTRTDTDYFRFTTGAGSVTLNVSPAIVGANLDIEATLYNSAGVVVGTSNPLQSLNATITANVPAGQYYLKVDGVGAGNPTANPPTGYTDYASIGQYSISGSIVNFAGDSLSIAATNASQNEGNSGSTPFTFTVTRTGDTSGTTTIDYVVVGTGAAPASGADFASGTLPSGSVSFGPGITTQTITINVQGDTEFESTEGFSVNLLNPGITTAILTGTASGSIVNDDASPAPPSISIAAKDASKAEGTGGGSTPFVFTVTRTGNTTGTSSVRYTVSPGSGSNRANSSDFTNGFPSNVLVTFGPGATSIDVVVNVARDSRREPNETFRIALANVSGATLATSAANGTILNDDTRAAAPALDADDVRLAVADPLWMFIPPQYLSASDLAVPVITWVNGVPMIGDLAHDHEDHDEHEHADHDEALGSLEVDDHLPEYLYAGGWSANLASSKMESLSVQMERTDAVFSQRGSLASSTQRDSLRRNPIRGSEPLRELGTVIERATSKTSKGKPLSTSIQGQQVDKLMADFANSNFDA